MSARISLNSGARQSSTISYKHISSPVSTTPLAVSFARA
ncbi:hypothetical protein D043_3942A, partial [Vibrio parahaemolyticus EKP-021]